jgi:hypothetical protein
VPLIAEWQMNEWQTIGSNALARSTGRRLGSTPCGRQSGRKTTARRRLRPLCGHRSHRTAANTSKRRSARPSVFGGFLPCSLAFAGNEGIGLLGHYSNQDLQGSLARLARKLAAVRASGGPRRRPTTCRQRPRRPGWVLKAIVQVLADQGEPMRPKDIHAAVEAALGQPVATSSIKTALVANASGSSPRLVRVAPGRYELA